MAQMQNQMQMQAQMQNQFVQHPAMPGFGGAPQMAATPWQSGSMAGGGMSNGSYFSSPVMGGAGTAMTFGQGGGWTVSGSPMPFEIPGSSGVPAATGPVPDPAFSSGSGTGVAPAPSGPVASGAPISTISLSAQADTAGAGSGGESPLVEAF